MPRPGPLNPRPHTPLCPPTGQPACGRHGRHGVRAARGGGTVCCPHPRPGLFTREKCTVFIALSIRGFLHRLALEIHLTNHTKCGLTRHTGRVLNQFRIIEERQVDEHSVGGQDWSRGEADLQQAECRAPALAQRTGGRQAKATDWGRAQKASRRRRGPLIAPGLVRFPPPGPKGPSTLCVHQGASETPTCRSPHLAGGCRRGGRQR